MNTSTFELAGTKTLKGLLVPYGETGQNANGEYVFSSGTIEVPAESFALKFAHPGNNGADVVLGNSVSTEETEAGLVVSFEIDDTTTHGKALLADYAKGLKKSLSAEFSAVKREGSRVLSAVLTGAATVVLGGFQSAAFFELDEMAEITAPEPATREAAVRALIEANEAALALLSETSEESTDSEDTATPTEEPDEEPDEPLQEMEVTTVANATAPNTLATEVAPEKTEITASNVFELITAANKGDEAANFALSDIKISGAGALPGAGVLQPSWLGELWSGRAYSRKYMSLVRNGSIRSLEEKGFTLNQGTALVARWTGNKTELPTGTASSAVASSTLYKYGYAADIAREFFDIPGGEEVLSAYYRGVINSYAKVTDLDALGAIVAAATANITAPETYPTEYPGSMGMLIQGIEAVEDAGDTPTFAIANELAWKELLYTPRDQVPEFVSFAFGTNFEGAADNGKLRVVKGDVGISDTAAVVVGSANAIHFNELAGQSPLQLDALDIAKGGVDRAVVGYLQFLVDFSDGLVLIGEADA